MENYSAGACDALLPGSVESVIILSRVATCTLDFINDDMQ